MPTRPMSRRKGHTRRASSPASATDFIRIRSDGYPNGDFLIEDSDGNPIDIPILSIEWKIEKDNFAVCKIETMAEVDIKTLPENFLIKDGKAYLPIKEFIDKHGKE